MARLAALVLVLAMVAGCSGDEDRDDGSSRSETTTAPHRQDDEPSTNDGDAPRTTISLPEGAPTTLVDGSTVAPTTPPPVPEGGESIEYLVSIPEEEPREGFGAAPAFTLSVSVRMAPGGCPVEQVGATLTAVDLRTCLVADFRLQDVPGDVDVPGRRIFGRGYPTLALVAPCEGSGCDDEYRCHPLTSDPLRGLCGGEQSFGAADESRAYLPRSFQMGDTWSETITPPLSSPDGRLQYDRFDQPPPIWFAVFSEPVTDIEIDLEGILVVHDATADPAPTDEDIARAACHSLNGNAASRSYTC